MTAAVCATLYLPLIFHSSAQAQMEASDLDQEEIRPNRLRVRSSPRALATRNPPTENRACFRRTMCLARCRTFISQDSMRTGAPPSGEEV